MYILASDSFSGIKVNVTPLSLPQVGSTEWKTGFPGNLEDIMFIITLHSDFVTFFGTKSSKRFWEYSQLVPVAKCAVKASCFAITCPNFSLLCWEMIEAAVGMSHIFVP
jgi:hypothetical protein